MQMLGLEAVRKFVHHPLPEDLIPTFRPALSGHSVVFPASLFQLAVLLAGMVGLQLTEEELRLAKQWYVDGHAPSEIVNRLGRNKCTLPLLRLPTFWDVHVVSLASRVPISLLTLAGPSLCKVSLVEPNRYGHAEWIHKWRQTWWKLLVSAERAGKNYGKNQRPHSAHTVPTWFLRVGTIARH